MRIFVTGPNGQLGSELVRQGCFPIVGRLGHPDTADEIERLKPDAIINCAAMTDVDGCEDWPLRAMDNNAGSVDWLSRHFKGYLIQISTDYIFDGKSGPYMVLKEGHQPNPLSIYGWSKLGGELLARRHPGSWLIVRTTVLFSRTENNFVSKVVSRLSKGEPVSAPMTLFGTPTYVPFLASEIIRIIEREYTGVAHIAGDRCLSRFDFALAIAEHFGFDPGLIGVFPDYVLENYALRGAPRPQRAGLVTGHDGTRHINDHDPFLGLRELAQEYRKVREV